MLTYKSISFSTRRLLNRTQESSTSFGKEVIFYSQSKQLGGIKKKL
jgi:hypothetical protein